MNRISKILFWVFTIGLAFINPIISFVLVILYYLPGIVQDLCKSCKEGCNAAEKTDYTTEEFINYEERGTRYSVRKDQVPPKMDSYSDDTLEGMK